MGSFRRTRNDVFDIITKTNPEEEKISMKARFAHRYVSIEESAGYSEFKKKFIEENCVKCRLCKSRTHLVFDRGNPQSKILIIGEAPGREEDKQGECFVGRAGKLLDRIMASAEIDTNRDTLIVNVVKCRPPDNRAPLKDEVEMCRPYLLKQIEYMRPEMIVLLGATAFRHVFPQKKVPSMAHAAGSVVKLKPFREGEALGAAGRDREIPCMVLYHPAYLLYNPGKKVEMQRHVGALREYLISRGLLAHPHPIPLPKRERGNFGD